MTCWRISAPPFKKQSSMSCARKVCAWVILFCRVARASRVQCQSGSDFRRPAETIFKVRETETVSPTRETRALPGSSPDQAISTHGRGDNLRVLAAAQLLCQKV